MVYRNVNEIPETQLNIDWYNALLDIPNLSEFDDEHLELIKDECYGLYHFKFEDGSYITIDLCHGSENYYDNCVWHSKDDSRNVTFDCSYCIDSEMEFHVDDNTYICKLTVKQISFHELLERLSFGETMEQICEGTIVECTGNKVYEDNDLYAFLEEMGVTIEDYGVGYAVIRTSEGKYYEIPYESVPNRFGEEIYETILTFDYKRIYLVADESEEVVA